METDGNPGDVFRYEKEDIMLNRLPVKLSPHQIGIQEMLYISEMRGACPDRISLLGVIPSSLDPGSELSPALSECLPRVAGLIVDELRSLGHEVRERN